MSNARPRSAVLYAKHFLNNEDWSKAYLEMLDLARQLESELRVSGECMSDATNKLSRLAALGAWLLKTDRESPGSDIDGWEVQHEAERLGLLVKQKVNESCGDYCLCGPDFPDECLRIPEDILAILNEDVK